ncbi:MAG: hypothetical protein CVV58_02985 [Tenericutes bacterium HGW-Tenericutes-3]|nr:MAG: hypothetical protein CVV58_02985 [Tenericutes bacterium HGW-Tenericutes-3]
MIKRRIIAVMPMVSLFLFLGSGLFLENWKLGWTFFLLIPVSLILLTGNPLKKLSEIIPMICLIVFLWLGFGFELWHPGWMVFLIIPLVNIIIEKRIRPRKMVSIVITAAYITIGLITEEWHPTWIIFLLIPIINTIFFPQQHAFVEFNSSSMKSKFRNIIIEEERDEDRD